MSQKPRTSFIRRGTRTRGRGNVDVLHHLLLPWCQSLRESDGASPRTVLWRMMPKPWWHATGEELGKRFP